MQNMHGHLQIECGSNLSNSNMDKHGVCAQLDKEESENGGPSYYLVLLSPFFNIKKKNNNNNNFSPIIILTKGKSDKLITAMMNC